MVYVVTTVKQVKNALPPPSGAPFVSVRRFFLDEPTAHDEQLRERAGRPRAVELRRARCGGDRRRLGRSLLCECGAVRCGAAYFSTRSMYRTDNRINRIVFVVMSCCNHRRRDVTPRHLQVGSCTHVSCAVRCGAVRG